MSAEPLVDQQVRRELRRVGSRMKWSRLAFGVCWWLAIVGMLCMALFLLDNLLHLPAALRLLATLAAIAVAAREFVRRIAVPALERMSPERAARTIESHTGRADNLLINACQFEGAALAEHEKSLVSSSLQGARLIVRAVPLSSLCGLKRLAAWAALAAVVGAGWVAYHAASPDKLSNAFQRFALPLGDVPPVGSVALTLEPGHDVVVAEGSDVVVSVLARSAATPPAPSLVWSESARAVAAEAPLGETVTLAADAEHGAGAYVARFAAVRRSFAFRVFCADSCTRSVRVTVAPQPRLTAASFTVTPPAYIGGKPAAMPGPPATLTVLAGSRVEFSATVAPQVESLAWRLGEAQGACRREGERWLVAATISEATPYEVVTGGSAGVKDPTGIVISRGAVQLQADAPPVVELAGADANQLLLPGAMLALRIQSSDDHGLREVGLAARDSSGGDPWHVKDWRYIGPPGPTTSDERFELTLDPARFLPGHSYVLEAQAGDWAPRGQLGRSKPVVLRIKALGDISAADPAESEAVNALKDAIAHQREAAGQTDNLIADLADALAHQRLPQHRDAIAAKQGQAQGDGRKARDEFAKHHDDAIARQLNSLVEGEMGLVLAQLAALDAVAAKAQDKLPAKLAAARDRQQFILSGLIALLGEAVSREQDRKKTKVAGKDDPDALPTNTRDAIKSDIDDLKDFLREQNRIVAKSRSLMDGKPLDLSDDKAEILGELAREEAKQAKFLEEKLTDFSKLPKQDFADSSLAQEFNEVWQEVSKADEALYKQAVELAVPHEQSGLELAKELENNLERWLSSHKDNMQWKMEEALQPADVPVSELPKELEDIVGELLDKEEEMQADVEDFSSAWMDNIDKGAGWDAGDGPISDMSAKGVTGNLLPNQNEVSGRSGEGRTGKSHGQMVEETASGKGGRETPSRLDPGPFEQGSVKDTAKDDQGGPTGGGKVSGYAAEGLRGPVPPPLQAQMARLAGAQAQIKQEAGALALEMRQRHVSSGNLESAVQAMQGIEDAAKKGNGGAIRQRYSEVVGALKAARKEADAPGTLHHERIDLGHRERDAQLQGGADHVPTGYEDMASQYFKALAEEGQ